MKKTGMLLFVAVMFVGWNQWSPAGAQEHGLPELASAYRAMLAPAKSVSINIQKDQERIPVVDPIPPCHPGGPRLPACRPVHLREFNLEYDGKLAPRWHLVPNPNPPGSGLLVSVDQGDHVKLTLTSINDTDWTTFEIMGLKASVDGKPKSNVFIYFGSFGVEQHTVEFDAAQPGIHLIRALYNGRVEETGSLVILGRKRPN